MMMATWRNPEPSPSYDVVIVGAGFGGLACALGLRHAWARVTVVDRRNYHLFQPLLYQVATASLSPADIATPKSSNFTVPSNPTMMFAGDTSRWTTDSRLPVMSVDQYA